MNFSKLDEFLEGLSKRYGVPACELIVSRGYDNIYHKVCGYSDFERTVPASENDVYWLYSETKVYTAVAVMMLYEKLELDLDDPVSNWLPEFKYMTVGVGGDILPARNAVTVRRLLCMAVGLGYDKSSEHILRLAAMNVNTREGARAFAEAPMRFEPGTHFCYNHCHDVLAALVEVISGMSYGEYLKKYIFDPLAISEISFDPKELTARGHRLSAQYRYDEKKDKIMPESADNAYRFGERYQSGGAGFCATARDFIKLPQALANGGYAPSGKRLLRPQTIKLMQTDQMKGIMRKEFNRMKSSVYTYGLGVRVRTEAGRCGEPVGEFGWDGAAGAYNMIDIDNKISIHYVQHVLDPYAWCASLHDELRETVYECLKA